jgi:hypothetical protein
MPRQSMTIYGNRLQELAVGGLNGPAISLHVGGVFGVSTGKTMVPLIITDEIEIVGLGGVQGRLQ